MIELIIMFYLGGIAGYVAKSYSGPFGYVNALAWPGLIIKFVLQYFKFKLKS